MRQFQAFQSLQKGRPDYSVSRSRIFYAILAFQKFNKIKQIQTKWPSEPLQLLICYKHQIIVAIACIPAV